MELYKRIRQRREDLNMSQDELASKVGYKSRSTIAKIEAGINDIPQSKISAFACALDTTPAELMGLEEKPLGLYDDGSTIAAHHNGDEWTSEELAELERYKDFIKSKRNKE